MNGNTSVEQCDREAAASNILQRLKWQHGGEQPWMDAATMSIRMGEQDGHDEVQAFARHRQQALARATQSTLVSGDAVRELELEQIADGAYGDGPRMRGAARQILSACRRAAAEGVDPDTLTGCADDQAFAGVPIESLRAVADTLVTTDASVVVPRVPTEAMVKAFVDLALHGDVLSHGGWPGYARDQWSAMLAASPALASPVAGITREEGWRPIDAGALNGEMFWLLVDYAGEEGDHPLTDATIAATIGFNSFDDTGVDEWKVAGWCWTHDHFVQGRGKVLAYRPIGFPLEQDGTLTPSAAVDREVGRG